jgi:putative oxidoreductase
MEIAMNRTHNLAGAPPSRAGLLRWAQLALGVADGWIAPVLDLGIRLFVGAAFFQSGLTKITSWSATLALFENEYSVPLLPPEVAAYLGTGAELFLPVLLVLGLGGRLAAVALFVFNIIAVISYPDLSPAGIKDHQYWGVLLLVTLFHGPGKLSLDHLIRRKFLA